MTRHVRCWSTHVHGTSFRLDSLSKHTHTFVVYILSDPVIFKKVPPQWWQRVRSCTHEYDHGVVLTNQRSAHVSKNLVGDMSMSASHTHKSVSWENSILVPVTNPQYCRHWAIGATPFPPGPSSRQPVSSVLWSTSTSSSFDSCYWIHLPRVPRHLRLVP